MLHEKAQVIGGLGVALLRQHCLGLRQRIDAREGKGCEQGLLRQGDKRNARKCKQGKFEKGSDQGLARLRRIARILRLGGVRFGEDLNAGLTRVGADSGVGAEGLSVLAASLLDCEPAPGEADCLQLSVRHQRWDLCDNPGSRRGR